MRVAIVGSCSMPVTCRRLVEAYVRSLPEGATVISGGAVGVDAWAAEAARRRGLRVEAVRPQEVPGRSYAASCFARDRDVVAPADLVVAFWFEGSTGTQHAVQIAANMRKPLVLVEVDRQPDGRLLVTVRRLG